jgi:NAD(P)-dependent dehydrogenase (short-subunit alcohol dehydrogenase family)
MSGRYEQVAVLVTGAASGIGLAVAQAYAAEGAWVVAVDMRPAALDALSATWSGPLLTQVADVRRAEQVERALDEAFAWAPHLSILINAAGIYPSHPLLEMDEADWDAVLDTNLKGPFLVSRGFARRLRALRRAGNIVNITSGSAKRARMGAAHYATSKAGLNMLTKAMALELAPVGIRVNAVSPGFVDVDSDINRVSEAYRAAITRGIPLGRAGRPDDIAHGVLFLTDPASSWITGTVLEIDGGSGTGNSLLPESRP